MIDIHSHILYGVDDGSQNKETTLAMLKTAQNDGITTMVATPHYITGANRLSSEELKKRYYKVLDLIRENNIEIELLLGNEVFLDEYIVETIKEEKCYSINSTKYILVEFPMTTIPVYTDKLLYELIRCGYIPIIAHPERYVEIQSSPNRLLDFIKIGCILQINSTSIDGVSGGKAQKTARLLLENNMVHLVASDCHSNNRRTPSLSKAYNRVSSWVGKDMADKLFCVNPKRVIENKEIDVDQPVYIHEKTGLFYRVMDFIHMAK